MFSPLTQTTSKVYAWNTLNKWSLSQLPVKVTLDHVEATIVGQPPVQAIVTKEQWQYEIREAMKIWNNEGTALQFVEAPANEAVVDIIMTSSSETDGGAGFTCFKRSSSDPTCNENDSLLGPNFSYVVIKINKELRWAIHDSGFNYPPDPRTDVAHEFGHVLGLLHTSEYPPIELDPVKNSALMARVIWKVHRWLSDDDKEGLRHLYGLVVIPPEIPKGTDAQLIGNITIPDGTVVSPNQSIVKIWRMKNTDKTTWGTGYKLAFVDGEQMGAPLTVDTGTVLPNNTVDLSVSITAPTTPGDHIGYFQLRNPSGGYFGEKVRVKIYVKTSSDPVPPPNPSDWEIAIQSVDSPTVVTPGQTFRPKVTVKVNQGQLLESRGDLLRNTDNNLYGAWPQVAVIGTVNTGSSYTFEFYQNNPITAPAGEGTYVSNWRVWRNGNWAGPEIAIQFDVKNGGGVRPGTPILTSPGNWSTSIEGNYPPLCVNAAPGVQYDFQIYQSHDTPDSGWINSNCWAPPNLGPYTYQWHVRAKSTSTGLVSDWSETWHFTIGSNQLSMDSLEFSPGSSSSAEDVRIYTCVHGFNQIGLGLELYANTASDGSSNGDWMWISPYGTFCYDHNNTGSWPDWNTLGFADGDHLIKAKAFGPQGQTLEQFAHYTLNRRRPNGPPLVNPTNDAFIKDSQITFTWKPTLRVSSYRLLVSTNSNPSISPLVDQTINSSVTQYTYTFNQAYPNIYWQVIATNELGSSSSVNHFSLDWATPVSSVTPFSSNTGYETTFPVAWGGADALSGVRWYDIQYRDGNRPGSAWMDWLTNTTQIAGTFVGLPGHTYYFRSRALDVASNLENWPADPNGDTAKTIDLNSRPTTPWWNSAYQSKRNLLILNNDPNGLPSGMPVRLHFDNGTAVTSGFLYSASQSTVKGDDLRIVFNNTTELTRYVQSFTPNSIDIWFNLQTSIGGSPSSDGTSYQLYYGNAAATNPPANINMVLPPPLEVNTKGLWHFQDGNGNTILDSSGNGMNGVLYNINWNSNGRFGYAAVFNGSSTYAEIPSSSLFDLPNFTIEGWFKFVDNHAQLILRRRMTTGTEEAYRIELRDSKFVANIRGGINVESQTLNLGQWYHLATTYDGQTLRVYVNGQLQGSQSFTQEVPASMGPIIIGRNSANSDYLQGEIQGLRISNVARSSFIYAYYGGVILNPPTITPGDSIAPPISGYSDLAIQSINSYSNPNGGLIIQVTVTNEGTLNTGNGFFTDLYLDHIPTGAGDYTGSLRFWVNDPIAPGATATLSTIIDQVPVLAALRSTPGEEKTTTLYAQVDSTGAVSEATKTNNVSKGAQVCIANADAYENDGTASIAVPITLGQPQAHNFTSQRDQDWVSFTAAAGKKYILKTYNLGPSADTYLYLYGQDGVTLLDSSDDDGSTLASRIEWVAPATGTYYILVRDWDPNISGCGTGYTLSVGYPNYLVYLPSVVR